MIKKITQAMSEALTSMYVKDNLDYYFQICSFIDFYEDETIPTICIGYIDFCIAIRYNPVFLAKQTIDQLKYLLIHEVMHAIFSHLDRTSANHNDKLANIAQDMIINYLIDTSYGAQSTRNIVARPVVHHDDAAAIKTGATAGDETGCVLPTEYLRLVAKGSHRLIFEELYDWLSGKEIKYIMFDEHTHATNSELFKQTVAGVIEKAAARAGYAPTEIKTLLSLSPTPPKNNLLKMAQAIATVRGTVKTGSYRRESRRSPDAKGFKREGHTITVGWDWSASMANLHEKVASELYMDGYQFIVIGGDTKVGNVFKITQKHQFKKIPFFGGGGTMLQPIIDLAVKKFKNNPFVLLTDGYIGDKVLDFSGLHQKVLILTTGPKCNVRGNHITQIRLT